MQIKPLNYLGEKGALAYPGTFQIFRVPLLSQERVKLRTSNLEGMFTGSIRAKYPLLSQELQILYAHSYILNTDRNKHPLQISGKVAVG